jgi:hypothetical protein
LEVGSAFAVSIHTDTSILALSRTIFNRVSLQNKVRTLVDLSSFNLPLPLQSAAIASDTLREPKLLAFKASSGSSTRELAVLVGRTISGEESSKGVFVDTLADSHCAIAPFGGVEDLPHDEVTGVGGLEVVDAAFGDSSTGGGVNTGEISVTPRLGVEQNSGLVLKLL